MKAINDCFEGAAAFRKLLDGFTEQGSPNEPPPRYKTDGTRAQRRAAERDAKAEQKRARKVGSLP